MSKRELRRVGVLARVASEELKLVDAAKILSLSYRQVKRIWQRYEKEGAKGLKHRSAGKGSNRAKPKKFRAQVIRLLRKKYSGLHREAQARFPALDLAAARPLAALIRVIVGNIPGR